ncbi:glycine zipper 2TM domain-containing protein [Shewanella sp. WXL01]|uniref:Glycine zipper 2TM domain-containing protein n=1 Tax=Shewanella maritima TaxID=2520507 RepID=A0A411PFT8_9GAMM|nr:MULTISPECIES: glycine zipper 2TM domain-containing protein [Shewanella]NKF49577.1 glycine zipper 2TM domain-containing protein [Shewanella sp. WXL01]QBF82324.1 glycine zipper 2TM domain-containing protein [Shewanella maritima]
MTHYSKIIFVSLLSFMLAACSSKPPQDEVETVRVGKVQRVLYQKVEKKPSIVTVLAGAAVGALIGNQIGDGNGKTIATGVGALGAAAITDKALTKEFNQVVYEVYVPAERKNIAVVSGDLASTIFKNDLVVVYKKGKKVTIDAYGQYSKDKYQLALQKLADGTLE